MNNQVSRKTHRRHPRLSDDLGAYLDHFRGRVIQDTLTEATSTYWLNRAATWEWVIHGGPVPATGDTALSARPLKPRAEWSARDFERQEIAEACRNKASVALIQTDPNRIDPDIWQALTDATQGRCGHCTARQDSQHTSRSTGRPTGRQSRSAA